MVDSILDASVGSEDPPKGVVWPDVASSTDGYAARFRGPVGAHFLAVQLDEVVAGLGVNAGVAGSILDVGGGHGQLAGPLAARGHSVTVLGSHASCWAHLQRRCEVSGLKFVEGPLYPLAFEDRAFDSIVAVRMLAHMDDHRTFLRELCRVSARRVVVDFPVRRLWDSLGGVGFALKRGVEGNTRRFYSFAESEIASVFHASGFRIVRAPRQFAIPMALHRAIGRVSLTQLSESLARRTGLSRRLGSPILMAAERVDRGGGQA